jgi:hypothetical protein
MIRIFFDEIPEIRALFAMLYRLHISEMHIPRAQIAMPILVAHIKLDPCPLMRQHEHRQATQEIPSVNTADTPCAGEHPP